MKNKDSIRNNIVYASVEGSQKEKKLFDNDQITSYSYNDIIDLGNVYSIYRTNMVTEVDLPQGINGSNGGYITLKLYMIEFVIKKGFPGANGSSREKDPNDNGNLVWKYDLEIQRDADFMKIKELLNPTEI